MIAERDLRARKSSTDPTTSELLGANAVGMLSSDVQSDLESNPQLVADVAKKLLSDQFPESIHQDILDAVGLSIDAVMAQFARDPTFRNRVLVAYEYRCALCGLDLRIGNVTVGLEAAHIKWHAAGGSSAESNGLALCCLHHKLFDLGAFTLEADLRVLVSEHVHGSNEFTNVLLRFKDERVRGPVRVEYVPHGENLAWHRREVFKGRPR